MLCPACQDERDQVAGVEAKRRVKVLVLGRRTVRDLAEPTTARDELADDELLEGRLGVRASGHRYT